VYDLAMWFSNSSWFGSLYRICRMSRWKNVCDSKFRSLYALSL